MRTKTLLLSLVIFCFTQESFSQIVASYSFNGNANDVSGNGHNGTVNGATLTTDKNSNPNSAYSFNGMNKYIYVPYDPAFNLSPSGQFTISLWINPNAMGPYAYPNAGALFVKCAVGPQCFNSMWDYGMYLIDTNKIMIGYANSHICLSKTHLQIGQWYCVAGTYNNGDWKVYINGILESSVINSGDRLLQSNGGISIGRKGDFSCDYFNGSLDEIRFYNKALSDSEIATVCNTSKPVSIFSPTDTAFCGEGGGCIDFVDYSTGNPQSWTWYFPGGYPDSSTQQNPTNICYYNSGTYSVTLVTSNTNGSDSVTVSPMVNVVGFPQIPSIMLLGADTLLCSSSDACLYQWYVDGIPIPGATDSFYVYNQKGLYAVRITSCLGCSSISSGFLVSETNEIYSEFGIRIFPNPAKDKLNLITRAIPGKTDVSIINVFGERIYTHQFDKINPLTEIDIKGFNAGIYFIKIQNRAQSLFEKLVIE